MSEYRKRREAAIEAVLAGEPVTVTAEAPQLAAVPDLMAVLAASLEAKPKATKKTRTQPAKAAA